MRLDRGPLCATLPRRAVASAAQERSEGLDGECCNARPATVGRTRGRPRSCGRKRVAAECATTIRTWPSRGRPTSATRQSRALVTLRDSYARYQWEAADHY